MHVTEVDGLEHALAYMVPNVIDSSAALSASTAASRSIQKPARLPISLIVIDSIGALFRASYDSNQGGLSQRSRMLCVLADRLKYLAHKYNIAVVVVNQVSDVFGSAPLLDGPSRISRPNSPALVSDAGRASPIPDGVQPTMTYKVQSQYFSGQTKSLHKEASLGLVWANAVNVRIMLSRTGRRRPLDAQDLSRRIKRPRTVDGRYRQDLEEEAQRTRKVANAPNSALTGDTSAEPSFEATLIRRMHLVFSPSAKQDSVDYVILQSGIHSLPPADYSANGENGETATSIIPGYQAQPAREASDNDFQNEVFDDLGNLPVDFWTSEAFDQMQEEVKLDGPLK
jgi:DNA repair protein RAD57